MEFVEMIQTTPADIFGGVGAALTIAFALFVLFTLAGIAKVASA